MKGEGTALTLALPLTCASSSSPCLNGQRRWNRRLWRRLAGWALSGPASSWECRAAQSRQARPEAAQEPSWGPAKWVTFGQAAVRPERGDEAFERRAQQRGGLPWLGVGFGFGFGLGLGSG